MIELIFAIVIIGITVVGVSRMMTQNVSTLGGALSQEAVFLASMEAAKVFSHRWDPNSRDNTTSLSYSKIIDTNVTNYKRTCINPTTGARVEATAAGCGTNVLSVLRLGGIAQDKHRRFHSVWTPAASSAPEGVPDISKDLNLTGTEGYKHNYGITIASAFVDNPFDLTAAGGATDIKKTEIFIFDKDNANTLLVNMRVYSFNIGEIDYAKRTFL